jgi:hypothetical protein
MKTRSTLLVIALGLAGAVFQANAAPPTSTDSTPPVTTVPATSPQLQTDPADTNSPPTAPSASANMKAKQFYWFTPAPAKNQSTIYWYGNESSRPWAEVCGWHPGQTQFPSAETDEPQLVLLQMEWGR